MRPWTTRALAKCALATTLALGATFVEPRAALGGPAELHADDVRIEPNDKTIDLAGNVRVDATPFHLRSEALRVTRTGQGLDIDGTGTVSFCECAGGPPLLLRFNGGLIGPPADLILRHPRLEVFGVPLMWLPYVWLRAPNRLGALPPEIAYRGSDGLYGSLGVHVPWSRDDMKDGINLRVGGYTRGGFASELMIERKNTFTRLRYDLLEQDGLVAESYGAVSSPDGVAVGWDLDALRGERAQRMTTALAPVSAPYDRARLETRTTGAAGTAYTNVRALGVRGTSDVSAWGPSAGARTGGALDRFGVFQAGIVVGTFGAPSDEPVARLVSPSSNALSFARIDGELVARRPVGPFGVSLQTSGAADILGAGDATYGRGTGTSTLRVGTPFARAFGERNAVRHWWEPYAAGTGLVAAGDSPAFGVTSLVPATLAAASRNAAVAVYGVGIENRLGTTDGGAGNVALTFDVNVGHVRPTFVVGDDGEGGKSVLRYRVNVAAPLLRAYADGAHVLSTGSAHAMNAGARFGGTTYLSGQISGRSDADPTLARVVQADLMAPFYAQALWSGTFGAGTLLGERVALRAESTTDLTAQRLLGAAGHLEIQDKCRCLVVGFHGSGRIGRPGADVWVSIDLPTLNH